jgi:two-component system response regulator RegX3
VIFPTARVREEYIVQGLSSGADDYVSKPAKKAEFRARIAAVLRRHGAEAEKMDTPVLGVYIFDLLRRVASIAGRAVELTNREFDLALYLFRRQGRIVSRNSLLEDVWNLSADVSTRTVDTHISRLRKKLELDDQHGWRLASIYQHGYRLVPM